MMQGTLPDRLRGAGDAVSFCHGTKAVEDILPPRPELACGLRLISKAGGDSEVEKQEVWCWVGGGELRVGPHISHTGLHRSSPSSEGHGSE